MDLPKRTRYGVQCPKCPAIIWTEYQWVAEMRCAVSFKDKGLPYIEDSFGLIVGFAIPFEHTCRPDLDY